MAVSERKVQEVQGEPLSGIALRAIREAIVEGRIGPGETINQVELSKQFGISRAPIREALRQLEKEGLVTNIAYRGTIVAPLTNRGIKELLSLRQLFEMFAAQQIISSSTDKDIAALQKILDDMQFCAQTADLDGMNAADIAFHTRIIQSSSNRLLVDAWERYVPLIRRTLALRNRANPDPSSIVALHEDLLDAFRSRDIDRLTQCYKTHGADIVSVLEPLIDEEET